MKFTLEHILSQYKNKIKGIIHIGAHYGQEYELYKSFLIKKCIFIEPCAFSFQVLSRNIRNDKDVMLLNCALGENEFTTEIERYKVII